MNMKAIISSEANIDDAMASQKLTDQQKKVLRIARQNLSGKITRGRKNGEDVTELIALREAIKLKHKQNRNANPVLTEKELCEQICRKWVEEMKTNPKLRPVKPG